MTKVILLSAAEVDYTESLIWYYERSIDTASNFDVEFDAALTEIANNPGRYPFCDQQHQFYLMRTFPFHIIYRVVNNEVLVVAVAHGSREPRYCADR